MKKTVLLSIALIAGTLALNIYLSASLPERMASHWNIDGEVDGYMDKGLGLFFLPALGALLLAVFLIIPKIDPLGRNIKEFMRYYQGMIIVMLGFISYLNFTILAWNLGSRFSMMQALSPAFGGLFYYLGILISNAKRNWSIGIRTPWTLSSESVWEKTHKIGGKLFKASGAIALLGIVFPEQAIWLVVAPVLAVSAYLFVYSYLEYRKSG